ncbi:MAG TPA: ABC transporter ATP-binding protein [Caulobacteraceae bacterium]|jgi:ABC-type multidrug transport system fused ATPase/permease subunit
MNPLATLRGWVRVVASLARIAFTAAPARASAAVGVVCLGAVLSLTSSYQIKAVVQAAAGGSPARALTAALILAGAAGAAWIANQAYTQLQPRVSEAITVHLDAELIRLTARIPTLEFADRPIFADKISLIRSGAQQLAGGLQAVTISLRTGVMLTGTFVILVGIDPWLALLPLFAIPRALAGRRARQLTVRAQEATAEPMRLRGHLFSHATSPVAGKELRVFGLGDELSQRYRDLTASTRQLNIRANWVGAVWSSLGDLAFTVGCVAAIAWLVVRAASGQVSPAGVVLAATMATGLVLQMNGALQFAQYLQAMTVTVERYLWLTDFSNEAVSATRADAAPPPALRRGIEVEGIGFAYPDRDRPALSDIWLELPAGRVVALVGENGSGKSTLVKLLCGFYRPSAGRILVDDLELSRIDPATWRSRIRGAFQDFANLEVTLLESVSIGELAQLGDRERTGEALVRAGAETLADLSPEGLDAMLGKPWGGMALSGGQWQKLALSRALMRERPLMVVFDEPTAALDPSAEHELFERLVADVRSGDAGGRSTLIVSHRFSTVRMADAIAVLDAGRIVEFGSHQRLMAAGGRYAELFELQARAYR